MWTQIVGKVRLALSLHLNHWWQVPLYITAGGMTASPIPYHHRLFEVILLVRLLLCEVFLIGGLAKLADLAGSRQALRDFGGPAAFVC